MATVSEFGAGLTIATVESVAPGTITAVLTLDAPHGTALNAQAIARFPRINGFVSVPSEVGAVLALVTWVGIDADRSGRRLDPDLVGLANPRRRIRLMPLGTIASEGGRLKLERGILVFPTVGDPVQLPTREQLHALSLDEGDGIIRIGTAPVAADAPVRVKIDDLLARHLAILGNTGSGKSCSAVLLLRRAIEEARRGGAAGQGPRVVILDANGEFTKSFDNVPGVTTRKFAVDPTPETTQLVVPGWLWNSREWAALAGARPAAQAPFLRRALRLLRSAGFVLDPEKGKLAYKYQGFMIYLRQAAINVASSTSNRDKYAARDYVNHLKISVDLDVAAGHQDELGTALQSLQTAVTAVISKYLGGEYPKLIDEAAWRVLADRVQAVYDELQDSQAPELAAHEDDPVYFNVDFLADAIELAAFEDEGGSAIQWMGPLVFRLRELLSDRRMRQLACGDSPTGLEDWLDEYVPNGQITIIDLSLVPSFAKSVVAAVVSRLIFEAHERYRRMHDAPLATILVLEEAHMFIRKPRYGPDEDVPSTANDLCRESFDRIAREGRKFGLSLVLTSQRPSELSETVLSQCNTFLVHRVVNDADQNLLRRLVPDALGELLHELPSFPSRSAVLLGWAAPVPSVMRVDELAEEFQPHSHDPTFVRTWRAPPDNGWTAVADQWIGRPASK